MAPDQQSSGQTSTISLAEVTATSNLCKITFPCSNRGGNMLPNSPQLDNDSALKI